MKIILDNCKLVSIEEKLNYKNEKVATLHVFRDNESVKINSTPLAVANTMTVNEYYDIPVRLSVFAADKNKGFLVCRYAT